MEVQELVEDLLTALRNMIMGLDPEVQLHARRAFVVQLIRYVQELSARTLTTLSLLGHFLPQPDRRVHTSQDDRFGVEAITYVSDAMDDAIHSRAN